MEDFKNTPPADKNNKKTKIESVQPHTGKKPRSNVGSGNQFYCHKEQTPKVKALLLGEYYHLFDKQIHPVTARWIDRVSEALMEWARKDTSLRITDFTDSPDIAMDPFSYYQFINQFAQLKLCHDYAMRRIASRRELGGMTNKYNVSIISKTQSHYDPTWAAQEEKIAKMAKDMGGMGNVKVVLLEFERLDGDDAPSYVQIQADEYHAKRSEFAEQEQALLEAETLTMATPEEVASGAKTTGADSRWIGAGQYVAASKVKRTIKENRAKMYESE